ncbi:MAG: antibiotic transport system ATP-binding protein [Bacillota bacterium]|nr:MAG: antibiotic transport system ATP-binding protein [Bacillota bacterium]
MITVSGLTLTYPSRKGVFDLDFTVAKGAVAGYLGPNGAGKTTTIRALLGFMRPDNGKCLINGLDCITQAPLIQKTLGYLPGEIAFPDGMTGNEFLAFLSAMRATKNGARKQQLLEMFELDPKGKIKKFSKGMKQKLGIVAAFMHDPEVLILDEPSSGLDPLMQHRMAELILAEKARGKTILMSSHIFDEIERVCDSVLIIKEGRIVAQADVEVLKSKQRKVFVLATAAPTDAVGLLKAEGFQAHFGPSGQVEVAVPGDDVDRFIKTAAKLKVLNLSVKHQTLEDVFISYYSKEAKQ